jgi:anti-sigma B factor antagonist
MNLEIKIDRLEENKYNVQLIGEVDAYTVPKLREEIIPLTEQENVAVTVELSGINYMDSTGLGVFIGALKSVKKHNGSLKLVGLNERIERLFAITGLHEVIEIEAAVRGGAK